MGCINMSEAGIEVRNDNNKLVVDSLYKNLMLSRKVSLSQMPAVNNEGTIVRRLHLNPGEIVAAVSYPKGSRIGIIQLNFSGYCDFYGADLDYIDLSSIDSNYVAYVFGVDQKAKGNVGMQIFNDNGDLIFDSNAKYMRVSYYGKNADDVIQYPDASKTYAIAQLGVEAYEDTEYRSGEQNAFVTSVTRYVKLGKDGVEADGTYSGGYVYIPSYEEIHYEQKCFSYMLIDVTGY